MNAPITMIFKGPPDNFDDMREIVRSTVVSLNELGVDIAPDHDGLHVLSSLDVQLHMQRNAYRMSMPLGVIALHLKGLGFEQIGAAESARFAIENEAFRALFAGASTEQKGA